MAQGKRLHEDRAAWEALSTMSAGVRKKIEKWHLTTHAEAEAARAAVGRAIGIPDYSLADLVLYVCLDRGCQPA